MPVTVELAAAGLLVGVLVGMTGMGGGSLLTPLLVLAFGFAPGVAVGTDLLHGAIFKTVAAARHRRLGTTDARLSGWMLLGSAPMSLVGVFAAVQLQGQLGLEAEPIQAAILGIALIAGAVGIVAKTVLHPSAVGDAPLVMTTRNRVAALVIGIFGGFVVGLTSVGSGVFFGLTLLVVVQLCASKVVGTDILHAAALLWVAGTGHLIAGNVDTASLAWLLVGSIPGALIGSELTLRIPDRPLRLVLALVLFLSGLRLAEPPLPMVLVATAVAVAALVVTPAGRDFLGAIRERPGARRVRTPEEPPRDGGGQTSRLKR